MAAQHHQCPSCGAPMRWKGDAPVVQCRYCKNSINIAAQEVTEEQAVVTTKIRPRNLIVSWLIIGIVMCTGIVPAILAGIFGESSGGLKKVPLETITSLSMAMSMQQMQDATGVEGYSDTSLCIYYKDGAFDYVCFGWDEDRPHHVEYFNFHCLETNESAEAVKAWLDFYFGPRLTWGPDGYSMYWAASHIHTDEALTTLGFHTDPDRDPDWETRIEWYWAAGLAATLGKEIEIDDATRRRWLGKGYTLAQIAKLDISDTVDEAQSSVKKRFPGAIGERNGQEWTIPVDHPWIGEAEFSWQNSEGGKLERAWLTPVADNEFTHQKSLRNCISKEFGKSEHHTTDHLAKTYRYSWEPRGLGDVDLHDHGLSIYIHDWYGKGGSKSEYKAVMKRLDACGR